jgi:hypothetical protein
MARNPAVGLVKTPNFELIRHGRRPEHHFFRILLEAFESGLDSWFRYPCALIAQDSKGEGRLFSRLWDGYGEVMRAYGKELRKLLNEGWNGPHGTFGRWELKGQWLGHETEKASS